jgi:hypothetical protein
LAAVSLDVAVAAACADLILDCARNKLPHMFPIWRRHGVEADRIVIGGQDAFEAPPNCRVVDIAQLVATEGYGPGLRVDADAVYLGRLVRRDDELTVGNSWVPVPALNGLRGEAPGYGVIISCGLEEGELVAKLGPKLVEHPLRLRLFDARLVPVGYLIADEHADDDDDQLDDDRHPVLLFQTRGQPAHEHALGPSRTVSLAKL